jgi:hypothetical protein
MASPNDTPRRGTDSVRRVSNTTTGWAIAGVILVLLVGLSFFYSGRGTHSNAGGNPPNAVTQPQPQK